MNTLDRMKAWSARLDNWIKRHPVWATVVLLGIYSTLEASIYSTQLFHKAPATSRLGLLIELVVCNALLAAAGGVPGYWLLNKLFPTTINKSDLRLQITFYALQLYVSMLFSYFDDDTAFEVGHYLLLGVIDLILVPVIGIPIMFAVSWIFCGVFGLNKPN